MSVFLSGLESAEDLYHRRITRILANEFPTFFGVITRVTRNSDVISPTGGVVGSTVDTNVEAVVPQGAFKKNVKLSLQVNADSYLNLMYSLTVGGMAISAQMYHRFTRGFIAVCYFSSRTGTAYFRRGSHRPVGDIAVLSQRIA